MKWRLEVEKLSAEKKELHTRLDSAELELAESKRTEQEMRVRSFGLLSLEEDAVSWRAEAESLRVEASIWKQEAIQATSERLLHATKACPANVAGPNRLVPPTSEDGNSLYESPRSILSARRCRVMSSKSVGFKSSSDEDQEDQENVDIDTSNEMKLLQKVVQKLAIIVELQTQKNLPANTQDMQDEDIGILSMMHGANIVEETARNQRRTCATPARKKTATLMVQKEELGVPQEVYHSWAFNALPLQKPQRTAIAVFTISRFHQAGEGCVQSADDVQLLRRFVAAVEKEYLPVPFHNFAHAIDVLHAVARVMRSIGSEAFLTELEQHALLIASLAHDLGHPGVNNGFLSEVGNDLALLYNDRSPLENMHCAKLYTIAANPATNVFASFTKEQYVEVRKCCIETILHTDMMLHQAMVKDLAMIYQMNSEVFQELPAMQTEHVLDVSEIDVFSQPENKLLVMEAILHTADVSNPCRTWEVTHAWAVVCLEEFFAQGDQEKMLGIPVQFLNDREKLNRPNSQIGFIEFMIAPLIASTVRLWPSLHELAQNLGVNLQHWEERWSSEVNPSEEDAQKVKARVEKVKTTMQDAACRRNHA